MRTLSQIILPILLCSTLFAQPNCELWKGDKACYQGCQTAMKAIRYSQGSHQSQSLFDKSIRQCPTFAYSYMEKGVPFLKRGQFVEWKRLIDKAVELSPSEYLGYRGWCRLQFLRDYKGAIRDIEELKRITNNNIGYCQTGDYHLEIVLAICYKEIGQLEKAKRLFEMHMSAEKYSPDLYDYYHFGRLEYDLGNFESARSLLKHQIEINGIAEPYFYLALVNKQLGLKKEYEANLKKAEEFYKDGRTIFDNYTEPIDKIYLQDIVDEMDVGFDMR